MSPSVRTPQASAEPGAAARGQLSRERIEIEALRIADTEGLTALSMRHLASELGVEAMSLYLHVRNKEAILAGVLDRLFAEVEDDYRAWRAAHAHASWRAQLRALAQSYYGAMNAHLGTAPLLVQIGQTPQRLEFMNTLLGILRNCGFSKPDAHRAMHVLQNYMVGHALRSHAVSLRGQLEIREEHRRAAVHTHLRHVAELEELEECDTAGGFPLGLEMLVTGVAAALSPNGRRATRATRPVRANAGAE